MEVHLLAIQARVLLWVALGVTAAGIWLGLAPWTVAWRAALAAVLAMWACRWLLGQVAQVMEERLAQDLAEQELAAERAKAQEAQQQQQAVRAQVQARARPGAAAKTAPAPGGR